MRRPSLHKVERREARLKAARLTAARLKAAQLIETQPTRKAKSETGAPTSGRHALVALFGRRASSFAQAAPLSVALRSVALPSVALPSVARPAVAPSAV